MGTSSSHRSPSTPEWERVKRLYREPNPDPGRVASLIVSALDAETKADMSGAGVACCLSGLLAMSRQIATRGLTLEAMTPGLPPLVAVSEAVRSGAEHEIARLGLAGGFTDLALRALGTATFEAGSSGAAGSFDITAEQLSESLGAFACDDRLHDLSLCFLGHDLDQVFRDFVGRDLNDFVGTENLPRNAQASQLRDAVGVHCRAIVGQLNAAQYERALHDALSVGEPRLDLIQATLAELTEISLRKLAVGE